MKKRCSCLVPFKGSGEILSTLSCLSYCRYSYMHLRGTLQTRPLVWEGSCTSGDRGGPPGLCDNAEQAGCEEVAVQSEVTPHPGPLRQRGSPHCPLLAVTPSVHQVQGHPIHSFPCHTHFPLIGGLMGSRI